MGAEPSLRASGGPALALLACPRPVPQDSGPSSPTDPAPQLYIFLFKIKEEADHSLIQG